MREQSGVPLGGIGAGKIEFFANGRFSNVATNNNWDAPIVDSIARSPAKPRILEGFDGSIGENQWRRRTMTSEEGLPGSWLAVHTPEIGSRLLKTDVRPALSGIDRNQIAFDGKFPRATVRYSGLGALEVGLTAFSGLELGPSKGRHKESSLPLAMFAVRAANTSDRPLPVHVAFSWQDVSGLGGYPHFPVNNFLGETPTFQASRTMPGLRFASTKHGPEPRFESQFALRVRRPRQGAQTDFALGWDPRWRGDDIGRWLSRGRLPRKQIGDGTAGVLGVRLVLGAHANDEILFALAWNSPHLIPSVTDWLALDDPQSSPPAPEWVGNPQRADLGHAYSNWYSDPWDVAEHGLREAPAILAGVDDWQRPLLESNLPDRFATALCNDLFPLYTNTWYTRNFTFSVNEAPTDMHGCMGTIDQRSVANAAISQSFPDLDRSELDLFTKDQIRADDDPRRYGKHWNLHTGRCDLPIDRAGSILHDVGWDHLEGGRTGGEIWLTPHWPDLTSVYVLQAYQHGIWNGDREWLRSTYPSIKAALKFQATLDQTGNGIPDLWGPGSLTYDTSVFPYFGSAPFIATLYIAALRAAKRLAGSLEDTDFEAWCERAIAAATSSMETELWNPNTGHYMMWRDDLATNWDGTSKAHPTSNPACHIGQLAGEWWTTLLGLDPVVPPQQAQQVLSAIYANNVRPVRGCPANESHEGVISESWTPYVLAYYAALAVAAGRPDEGWEAVDKIYRVRYELDGSPWDAPLEWSGEHNETAQWGRFYMSNPASWYVLQAIGGLGIDRIHGRAWLKPSWPTSWGNELRAVPFFLPGWRGTISAQRAARSWEVQLLVTHIEQPVSFESLSVALPGAADNQVDVEWSPISLNGTSRTEDGQIVAGPITFERPGDRISLKATW